MKGVITFGALFVVGFHSNHLSLPLSIAPRCDVWKTWMMDRESGRCVPHG